MQAAACMADLVPQGRADVTGVISAVRAMSVARAPACRYTLTDGTGEVDLFFLGRSKIGGIECGRRCRAVGTVARRDDRLVLWNPRYWLQPADPTPLAAGAGDYLSKPLAVDTLPARVG